MNKIFKIVWNAARGKMMVVNEATSSVQTGKKATVTVAMVGALAVGAASAATITETETDYSVVSGQATLIHSNGTVHSNDIYASHGVFFVTLPENKNLTLSAQNYLSIGEDLGNGEYGNVVIETTGDLSLLGSRITNFETGDALRAKNITLTSLNGLDASSNILNRGGEITATEVLTFLATPKLADVTVKAQKIVADVHFYATGNTTVDAPEMDIDSCLDLYGNASVNTNNLSIGATATIGDDAGFAAPIDKVTFKGKADVANAPRIQLMGSQSIEIGELVVEKSTGTDGSVKEAMLTDKMTNAEEGVTSFKVDTVTIEDSAALSVYADSKADDTPATSIAFGSVDMSTGSKLNLGFRGSDFDNSLGSKAIGSLTMGEGATLTAKTGSSDSLVDDGAVDIGEIKFEGNGSKVAATVTGEETNITVGEGVEGAEIAKISADKAVIDVAAPGTEGQLTVGSVGADTTIEVTTDAANNTGDAEGDLGKLASAVSFVAEGNEGTVNFGIDENDVYGALSGTLDKTGLSGVVQAVNTKTQAVADQVTLAPQMITRIMMNDVRKRMGDLRAAEGTHGVWARYNGGQMAGSGMEADFNMIQVGIDTVPVADAPRFGVAFSYAQTEADATNGLATTDMDAFSLAFYGTKMYDNGMFVDVIGRMATVDADMKVSGNKGKMDNVALSLSGELGWRFDVTDRFFIEPSAELTYTYTNADTFTMGTGKYELDATDSLVGRAGFAAGFKCPANKGDVYVRAAVVHEFMGDVTMNSWGANGNAATPIETDGEDTYFEYAVGAQFNINKNTYVYADVERTEGANVDEDWRANVGVRFAF